MGVVQAMQRLTDLTSQPSLGTLQVEGVMCSMTIQSRRRWQQQVYMQHVAAVQVWLRSKALHTTTLPARESMREHIFGPIPSQSSQQASRSSHPYSTCMALP